MISLAILAPPPSYRVSVRSCYDTKVLPTMLFYDQMNDQMNKVDVKHLITIVIINVGAPRDFLGGTPHNVQVPPKVV